MTKPRLPLLAATAALALLCSPRAPAVEAFPALASTPSESSQLAKLMLRQSLLSPSGKLTLSPEIIIPEPTDPTAMLLQTTEIQKLSETLRTKAKSNVAFIAGSLGSLRTMCAEQEDARGSFPGPVPVVYCSSNSGGGGKGSAEWTEERLTEAADAGACGVLLTLNGGSELDDAAEGKDAAGDGAFVELFKLALSKGLQPIPEAVIPEANAGEWGEGEVQALVDALTEGCGEEPVGVVLSVIAEEDDDEGEGKEDDKDEETPADEDADEGEEEESEEEAPASALLPTVAKPLSKSIPILGSVRAPAGGGRIGTGVSSLKECGFTGAILRCECVPGYRLNPDLEEVGSFWSAAISDLKSTRSKSFGFRAKVANKGLSKDVPGEWMKYQKSVMESGALGSPEEGPGGDFDSDGGDYQGF
eukprot:CAMPEP_0113547970 /NCGR_PEP_ID=MMETSP0015_2-20120614/12642_1 /TAXON_ID=2838 /ORGANISM="Odontella" /LENGTH=416 /DNA_ID=CAMNT_0000448565 /DNA_START=8 /DNA_END=1258 /DNA_ORIENTATION=- /assembly_acc=CAM_ASM_000160